MSRFEGIAVTRALTFGWTAGHAYGERIFWLGFIGIVRRGFWPS